MNYLSSGWLLIDLLTIFPYFYYISILDIISRSYDTRKEIIFMLFQFLRVFKCLIKINEISIFESIREFLGINTGKMKVIFFFANSVILSHNFSSIFYYSAILDNFNPSTWVHRLDLLDTSLEEIYIKSLYFSFVVFITVGYGDIVPYTNSNFS